MEKVLTDRLTPTEGFMTATPEAVTELSEKEAWELLATRPVGRLATSVAQQPDIFPVNFVLDDGCIVFRTAQGSKLLELTINEHVAFEVDDWETDLGGWSVVCHGTAEVIEHQADLERAESLDLRPWVQTIKTVFVRIRVVEIVGRRFRFGNLEDNGL